MVTHTHTHSSHHAERCGPGHLDPCGHCGNWPPEEKIVWCIALDRTLKHISQVQKRFFSHLSDWLFHLLRCGKACTPIPIRAKSAAHCTECTTMQMNTIALHRKRIVCVLSPPTAQYTLFPHLFFSNLFISRGFWPAVYALFVYFTSFPNHFHPGSVAPVLPLSFTLCCCLHSIPLPCFVVVAVVFVCDRVLYHTITLCVQWLCQRRCRRRLECV